MRLRISIRALLGLVAVVACVLGAFAYWLDPVNQYRWQHDEAALDRVLNRVIAPGETLARVEALLGPLKPATLGTVQELRRVMQKSPRMCPDGFQDGDDVRTIGWTDGGYQILQFRDGRLINYNPANFEQR